jgi:hypothetical protein
LLGWLKGLRETHGSVEQSSLSLASAINAQGVYHVGWSETHTDRVSGMSQMSTDLTSINMNHERHVFFFLFVEMSAEPAGGQSEEGP